MYEIIKKEIFSHEEKQADGVSPFVGCLCRADGVRGDGGGRDDGPERVEVPADRPVGQAPVVHVAEVVRPLLPPQPDGDW